MRKEGPVGGWGSDDLRQRARPPGALGHASVHPAQARLAPAVRKRWTAVPHRPARTVVRRPLRPGPAVGLGSGAHPSLPRHLLGDPEALDAVGRRPRRARPSPRSPISVASATPASAPRFRSATVATSCSTTRRHLRPSWRPWVIGQLRPTQIYRVEVDLTQTDRSKRCVLDPVVVALRPTDLVEGAPQGMERPIVAVLDHEPARLVVGPRCRPRNVADRRDADTAAARPRLQEVLEVSRQEDCDRCSRPGARRPRRWPPPAPGARAAHAPARCRAAAASRPSGTDGRSSRDRARLPSTTGRRRSARVERSHRRDEPHRGYRYTLAHHHRERQRQAGPRLLRRPQQHRRRAADRPARHQPPANRPAHHASLSLSPLVNFG